MDSSNLFTNYLPNEIMCELFTFLPLKERARISTVCWRWYSLFDLVDKETRIKYYENGNIKKKTNYKRDKLHGLDEGWYSNGRRYWRRMWENGKEHGLDEGWYSNGRQKWRITWENGICINNEVFDYLYM